MAQVRFRDKSALRHKYLYRYRALFWDIFHSLAPMEEFISVAESACVDSSVSTLLLLALPAPPCPSPINALSGCALNFKFSKQMQVITTSSSEFRAHLYGFEGIPDVVFNLPTLCHCEVWSLFRSPFEIVLHVEVFSYRRSVRNIFIQTSITTICQQCRMGYFCSSRTSSDLLHRSCQSRITE